jgi:hypothetical protein
MESILQGLIFTGIVCLIGLGVYIVLNKHKHIWTEPEEGKQSCKECGEIRIVPCAHRWGEVKENYQHCTICGIAQKASTDDEQLCAEGIHQYKKSGSQDVINASGITQTKVLFVCHRCGHARTYNQTVGQYVD